MMGIKKFIKEKILNQDPTITQLKAMLKEADEMITYHNKRVHFYHEQASNLKNSIARLNYDNNNKSK